MSADVVLFRPGARTRSVVLTGQLAGCCCSHPEKCPRGRGVRISLKKQSVPGGGRPPLFLLVTVPAAGRGVIWASSFDRRRREAADARKLQPRSHSTRIKQEPPSHAFHREVATVHAK